VTITQLRARRTEIERTAREFGASNIRVFGSVARGDAGPDSDVDLLVDMERGRGLLALAGLELALERLLGSDVDVTTPGGLKRGSARRFWSRPGRCEARPPASGRHPRAGLTAADQARGDRVRGRERRAGMLGR